MSSKKILLISCLSGIAVSVLFYLLSPDNIATHFNAKGYPDAWSNKSNDLIIWIAIYIFMTSMFGLLSKIIEKLPPGYVNIPNNDYWLAKKRVKKTINFIDNMLNWMGIAINIFFIIMGFISFQANRLEVIQLNNQAIYSLLVIFIVFIIIWLIRFYGYFRIKNGF